MVILTRVMYTVNESTKVQTLSAELAHPVHYEPDNMILLRLTTIYLRLTLVGNGRQMKLSHTSTSMHELQMADLASEK